MSFSLYCSFFVYVLLLCCILFSARGKNKDRIPVPYQKVGILHLVILAIIYLLFEKLGFDQCDKVERSGCVSTLGAECRISFAVPCTLCYMILGEAKCLELRSWLLFLGRKHHDVLVAWRVPWLVRSVFRLECVCMGDPCNCKMWVFLTRMSPSSGKNRDRVPFPYHK
ncbi:PREDICTED: uncharacterized protein LOC104821512 isoform X2 [Tarenaya hassleriana]|uniref:uncharacterized protein LOC104821512 isoform X2 n=1 Tax=Tarenaya hassleriana TaxID=28532 RepID=UPI00053C10F8|nr:PREDICTED: uncharacterized protein LOC104821512 isoform X2 [Tarenaya hassleriana]